MDDLQFYINKWTDIALGKYPQDKAKAEAGIDVAYQHTKHKLRKIVWCGSPYSAKCKGSRENKRSLDFEIHQQIFPTHPNTIVNSTVFGISDAIESLLPRKRKKYRRGHFFEYNTLALIDFFGYSVSSICGNVMDIPKSASWWQPQNEICYICEHPNKLNLDEDGKLHCDNDVAVGYPDGFGIWVIHGVQVTEEIVKRPETQNIRRICNELNSEVRRIRIDRYGWERYLCEVKATVLDKRRNDVENTEEVLLGINPSYGNMRVLICHCPSTGRIYTMEVPSFHIETCEQAQNYLWGGSRFSMDLLWQKKVLNLVGRS